MLNVLYDIRADERRTVAGAFLTLLAIMVSHALLETARDALFLAKLPPSKLPWVYLGIAAFALGLRQLETRILRRFESRRALAIALASSGVVTLALWMKLGSAGSWILYATYVWSGVMATLIVVRFWALVSDVFTVTQAKRVFAVIGTGSVLGAIFGAGLARFLTQSLPAEQLLPVAGGVLLIAAVAPLLLRTVDENELPETPLGPECDTEGTACLRNILSRPYVARLLAMMVVSTIALTVIDFLFKTIVAERIPSDRLGAFFSQIYLILNLLSLVIQVAVVQKLVRSLGIQRVLIATPMLLVVAAFVVLGFHIFSAGLVLAGVVAAKGIDGALRHSLHRTTSEMLYVPLSRELRARAKSFIDVAGQRGGQAIASLLILLIELIDPGLTTLMILAAVTTGLWVVLGYDLRQHYLNLFRNTLQEGHFETQIEHPDLDMASLETLIATLNSPQDNQVLAALDLLETQDRARLIPAMILYHPSPEIVIAALDIFARAKRKDFLPIAQRLTDSANPQVRAATVRATSAVAPEEFRPLDQFLDDPSPAVRATALVGLVSSGWLDGTEAEAALKAFSSEASHEERVALARAIADQPATAFASILIDLAASNEVDVRHVVAGAMRHVGHESFLPELRRMLAHRRLREAARRAFLKQGAAALAFLNDSLGDPTVPIDERRHIPRTIQRFDPLEAAPILLRQLTRDPDGVVRYKILRALGGMRNRNPNLPLDDAVLRDAAYRTLEGAYRLLDWRLGLVDGVVRDPERGTPVHEMLVSTLQHKEKHTIERLFRLLGLLHPDEDFQQIHNGILSDRASVQSSSIELLEALVENPMRDALVGFLDDVPDKTRLARGRGIYRAVRRDYLQVLTELLDHGGLALRCLTVYHIGELGLEELEPRLESLESEPSGFLHGVVERALILLQTPTDRGMRYE